MILISVLVLEGILKNSFYYHPQGGQSGFFKKVKSVQGRSHLFMLRLSSVEVRYLCFQIVFFLEYKVNVVLTQ